MKKPSKILFLATVCTAVLFAGCASDYMDDPDYRVGAMNDPCTHEWILLKCPDGLVFNPNIMVCDWPELSGGFSAWFYYCSNCGAASAAGGGPMLIQAESWDCVATVVKWLCNQMGSDITIEQIYAMLDYEGVKGVPIENFSEAMNKFFITSGVTNIFEAIDSGALIVATINGGTHCVVIVGRAGLEWLYNDPAIGGPGSTFSQGYFSNAMIILGLK